MQLVCEHFRIGGPGNYICFFEEELRDAQAALESSSGSNSLASGVGESAGDSGGTIPPRRELHRLSATKPPPTATMSRSLRPSLEKSESDMPEDCTAGCTAAVYAFSIVTFF